MKILELAVALAGTGLELVVVSILFTRRLYKRFPWFFVYVLFSVFETAALFAVRSRSSVYFGLYWSAESVTTILIFLALQETFRAVFRYFYTLRGFKFIFPAIAILFSAVAIPGISRAAAAPNPLTRIILSVEIAIGFLQIGLFLLFYVLVRFFRVRWQQYPYGIAFGFGVLAGGTLSAFLLRSEFGTKFNIAYQIIVQLSYTLAVVVWLATFLTPEPAHPLQGKVLALTPEEMLAEIKQYSSSVKKILSR
jgi:hypothetical protein